MDVPERYLVDPCEDANEADRQLQPAGTAALHLLQVLVLIRTPESSECKL